MADSPDRLKVFIDFSSPIVVMETVEEMRAVRMVQGTKRKRDHASAPERRGEGV